MGYALITSEIGDGRYNIQVDLGEAHRQNLIAAATAAIAKYTNDLVTAENNLTAQEAIEAQFRVSVAEQVQAILNIQTDDPQLASVAAKAAIAVYDQLFKQYVKITAASQPLRRTILNLKSAIRQAQQQYNTWDNYPALVNKGAWCTDYTLGASGYVATMEVNGESDLQLIAPGARGWQPGDGTVQTERKAANVATLTARLTAYQSALASLSTSLTAAESARPALQNAVKIAQTNYINDPNQENKKAMESAEAAFVANNEKISSLKAGKLNATLLVNSTQTLLAYWTALPASDLPYAGDGVLLPREFMSPEQAYFNCAILPGWQKFQPTYRRGTLTTINGDGTGTVTLADATSSAQGLGVNQTSTLSNVPVTYLSCDMNAFQEGDDVIVQFEGQNWANPRIIGFVDNPRPCGHVFAGLELTSGTPDYGYVFFIERQEDYDRLFTETLYVDGRRQGNTDGDNGWHELVPPSPDPSTTGLIYREYKFNISGAINNPSALYFRIVSSEHFGTWFPPSSGEGSPPASVLAVLHAQCYVGGRNVDNQPIFPGATGEYRMYLNGELFSNFEISSFEFSSSGRIKSMTGYDNPQRWGRTNWAVDNSLSLFYEE